MLNQRLFYNSISPFSPETLIISKFRQVGDVIEAGYLPNNSGGACSYTALDFHRAVSQGCQREWMAEAEKAKQSSVLWQAMSGQRGNSFGARQQLNFLSPEHTAKDPLFTRSLPEGIQQLTGDKTQHSSTGL